MPEEHDYLRRLDDSFYQGGAIVHWTHTIEGRKRGWLKPEWHDAFRELLIHAATQLEVQTIAYVLMLDHFHILWQGSSEESDQKRTTPWLRRRVNRLLADSGCRLQKQAYDHVLRPEEKDRFALEKVAHYIWANHERAKLGDDWPYRGSVLLGDADLSWQGVMPENFWDRWFEARK